MHERKETLPGSADDPRGGFQPGHRPWTRPPLGHAGLRKSLADSDTTVVLSPDSEFFRFFLNAQEGKTDAAAKAKSE